MSSCGELDRLFICRCTHSVEYLEAKWRRLEASSRTSATATEEVLEVNPALLETSTWETASKATSEST